MHSRWIGVGLLLGSFFFWGIAGGAAKSEAEVAPRLIHDFFPGEFEPGSSLERLTQIGETLFFIGRDLETGRKLWRTEEGGTRVQRVPVLGRTEQEDNYHEIVGQIGPYLLWRLSPAEDPFNEILLSSTVQGDGIPLHSYRPRDVDWPAISKNRFFFQDCSVTGCEVWSTDGTVAGTRALTTVNARFSGGPLQISGTFADRWLLLRVRQDLFAYDFVADRIQILLPKYAQSANLHPVGNTLFFLVSPFERRSLRIFASRLDSPQAVQVFESPVINIAGGRGDRLYFSAGEGRLWSTDGRPEGTRSYSGLKKDLYNFSESVDQLGAIGSTALLPMPGYYFGGLLGVDETKGEVRSLKTLCRIARQCQSVRISPMTLAGDKAFGSVNEKLLVTDGTREGTRLSEIFSEVDVSSFRGLAGRLLLGGTSREGEPQLWETDGTEAGTRALSNGTPDQPFRVKGAPVPIGGGLLVPAERKPVGEQLWRVADGRATALTSLRHLASGVNPYIAVPLGNRVVFKGSKAGGWMAAEQDGSIEALPALDVICESQIACSILRVVVGQRILFSSNDLLAEDELWSSDGTAAGSGRIALQDEAGNTAGVASLGRLGEWGLILDSLGGAWTSDGTLSGTRRFARLPFDPSVEYQWVGEPVPFGSWSFLFRQVPNSDRPIDGGTLEIWRTDGTQSGTLLLASTSFPLDFASDLTPAVVGGRLFFRFGGTLWMSDGSAAGTHPLQNQLPGGTFALAAGTETLYAGAGYLDDDPKRQTLWALNPRTLEASPIGTFYKVASGGVGTRLGDLLGDALFFRPRKDQGEKSSGGLPKARQRALTECPGSRRAFLTLSSPASATGATSSIVTTSTVVSYGPRIGWEMTCGGSPTFGRAKEAAFRGSWPWTEIASGSPPLSLPWGTSCGRLICRRFRRPIREVYEPGITLRAASIRASRACLSRSPPDLGFGRRRLPFIQIFPDLLVRR